MQESNPLTNSSMSYYVISMPYLLLLLGGIGLGILLGGIGGILIAIWALL